MRGKIVRASKLKGKSNQNQNYEKYRSNLAILELIFD